jgi:hypothetical protein
MALVTFPERKVTRARGGTRIINLKPSRERYRKVLEHAHRDSERTNDSGGHVTTRDNARTVFTTMPLLIPSPKQITPSVLAAIIRKFSARPYFSLFSLEKPC